MCAKLTRTPISPYWVGANSCWEVQRYDPHGSIKYEFQIIQKYIKTSVNLMQLSYTLRQNIVEHHFPNGSPWVHPHAKLTPQTLNTKYFDRLIPSDRNPSLHQFNHMTLLIMVEWWSSHYELKTAINLHPKNFHSSCGRYYVIIYIYYQTINITTLV